jgi:hypothetical protein
VRRRESVMPYSIKNTGNIIRVTYSGTLTDKDIFEVLGSAVTTQDGQINSTDRFEDMRELKAISIGFDELWDLAQDIQKLQIPRTVKSAIVTANPVQYGIARMFQSVLMHPQIKVRVFSEEGEADRWLSVNE